jgi:hypothetical protein
MEKKNKKREGVAHVALTGHRLGDDVAAVKELASGGLDGWGWSPTGEAHGQMGPVAGEDIKKGSGARGRGRLGPFRSPGSAQRPIPFFCLFCFYLFLLFEYTFEAQKISVKIQIRYRWIPCEKSFTIDHF